MSTSRKISLGPLPGHRPLTARSVLASALLGEEPPRLPVAQLVRLAAAFDINENRARVALSRMVANAEVRADDGTYELISPPLLARQSRQRLSRTGATLAWDGTWLVGIVSPLPATAQRRAERRQALGRSRFAEYRDGVWARPDNLEAANDARSELHDVHVIRAAPLNSTDPFDPLSLQSAVPRLWDLGDWAATANDLATRLTHLNPSDPGNLASCFELSAACLRHFQRDPLLPAALLPAGWPGDALRATYNTWDRTYRGSLRSLR